MGRRNAARDGRHDARGVDGTGGGDGGEENQDIVEDDMEIEE